MWIEQSKYSSKPKKHESYLQRTIEINGILAMPNILLTEEK
jgi:hypothetical protein